MVLNEEHSSFCFIIDCPRNTYLFIHLFSQSFILLMDDYFFGGGGVRDRSLNERKDKKEISVSVMRRLEKKKEKKKGGKKVLYITLFSQLFFFHFLSFFLPLPPSPFPLPQNTSPPPPKPYIRRRTSRTALAACFWRAAGGMVAVLSGGRGWGC